MRRLLLLGAGGLAVSACAPNSTMGQLVRAYGEIERSRREYPFTAEQVRAFSGALLGVQVAGGLKGLMSRREQVAGQELWQSSNGIQLLLGGGRILRSEGFSPDLRGSRLIQGEDPLGTVLDSSRSYRFSRQLDIAPDRYGLSAEYSLEFSAMKELRVLDRTVSLALWDERVRLTGSRIQWRNRYWCEPLSGEIVRSEQHLSQDSMVIVERLKG